MAETTGQLDKLIEEKVNKQIEEFAKDITSQVQEFLKNNGSSASSFYQASKWSADWNGHNTVTETSYQSAAFFKSKLIAGLNKSLKDTMITRETKALLNKIELLS
jgi:hypothetical protein